MSSIARLATVTAIMGTACATGFVVQASSALFMKAGQVRHLESFVAEAHAANTDAAPYPSDAARTKKNHLKSLPE